MADNENKLRQRFKALFAEHEGAAQIITWRASVLLDALGVRSDLFRMASPAKAAKQVRPPPTSSELDVDVDVDLQMEDEDESSSTEPGMQSLSASEMSGSIGGIEIIRELGYDPLGRVLLGHDPELGREVVVQVFKDTSDVHTLERFLREQIISAWIDHPGIVPVFALGLESDGVLYAVRGRRHAISLRELMLNEPWNLRKLLHVLLDASWAVAAAHARGVLHRSLSPECIFVSEEGGVFVADWRVSTLVGLVGEPMLREPIGAALLCNTPDGTPVGILGYTSPEQLAGHLELLDARSDVWSLGSILFEIVTGTPAIPGTSVAERVQQTLQGLPEDPRSRAPERLIDEHLAELCLSACALDRTWRFDSARSMARVLERWLHTSVGSSAGGDSEHIQEREEKANAFEQALVLAYELWARYEALSNEREPLQIEVQELRAGLKPWAEHADKRPLRRVLKRLGKIEAERTQLMGRYVTTCEVASRLDPSHEGIQQALASAYWGRLIEAEARRDWQEALYLRERVVGHDDALQTYSQMLSSQGALSVYTELPGAWVVLQRYDQSGLYWLLEEGDVLGASPVEQVSLDEGSYVITIRQQGMTDLRYPVLIRRGELAECHVPMLPASLIPPDFIYVPKGPFLSGGDRNGRLRAPQRTEQVDGFLISRFPITFNEYVVFLEHLLRIDPDLAVKRAPRAGPINLLVDRKRKSFFPSPHLIPEHARKIYPGGEEHEGHLPVSSINVSDALSYIAFRQERDGFCYRLPSTLEWEKAARGVDGRIYPWGDTFDAIYCKMRMSRDLAPFSEPIGAFVTDESVYGVRDMAGSIQEWCRDPSWKQAYLENPGFTRGAMPAERPPRACAIRGGAWSLYEGPCAVANHRLASSDNCAQDVGFRLAIAIGPNGPTRIEEAD